MRNNRGNILFLILLAVVLFAALSYAVTSSMRGGGKDAGGENTELGASQILQWFSAIDNAVMRMNLRGIAYEDISFRYDGIRMDGIAYGPTLENVRCTSDSCRVFKLDGGGVAPPDLVKWMTAAPTGWGTTTHLRSGLYGHVGQWPGAGTDKVDGALYIEGVSPAICAAIRSKIAQPTSITTGGTAVAIHLVSDWDTSTRTYNGSFLYGSDTYVSDVAGSGDGQSCTVYHVAFKR